MGVALAEVSLGRGSRFDHIIGTDAFKDHSHMKVRMKVPMPLRERSGIGADVCCAMWSQN
jgi:hypothetical protein